MRSNRSPSKKESKKPMIAGVLMIIVFLMAMITASGMFLFDTDALTDIEEIEEEIGEDLDVELVETAMDVCGALILVFGIVALISALCAIKRIYWGLALLGSILGIFTIGPWFLGSILSIAALILLIMSRDSLSKDKEENQSFTTSPPSEDKARDYDRQFDDKSQYEEKQEEIDDWK